MSKVLYYTRSLCPVCLDEIDATIVEKSGAIYMHKTCKKHGNTQTLIWNDLTESYMQWLEYGGVDIKMLPQTKQDADWYFYEIAKRPAQPVSAALMATSHCNAHCPVCFTRDQESYMPSLHECRQMLEGYKNCAGIGAPLEFCGGEPTVRDDLPQLASIAREMGFDYIQLNTNGFRIANDMAYTKALKENGITTVYLGFDGNKESSYVTKYGRNVLPLKYKAIEHARKAGLAVVLVPCIIPGSNDDCLGEIIRFAKENMPTVKGVYFQPVSYFGAYPDAKRIRITIPDLMRKLVAQTGGEIQYTNFLPGVCEHPACSFSAYYMKDKKERLCSITKFQKNEVKSATDVRKNAKRIWAPSSLQSLSVGGMAFMDVWNIDLFRVSKCSVQIITREGKTVPLCAKYVTAEDGTKKMPNIN